MKRKRLALLVALYISLDLSNPFAGSAFTFDPDETVQAARLPHERACDQPTPSDAGPLPLDTAAKPTRISRARAPVRPPRDWFVDPRGMRAPACESPPPSEED